MKKLEMYYKVENSNIAKIRRFLSKSDAENESMD